MMTASVAIIMVSPRCSLFQISLIVDLDMNVPPELLFPAL
jgi:hypothetical protein